MLGTRFVIVLLLVAMWVPPATADDRKNCASGAPDRGIAACTAIIKKRGETKKNLADAYYNRGEAYFKKQDYEHAIADYSEAVRLDPRFSRAFVARGDSSRLIAEYDRALADLAEAIRLDPKSGSAFSVRGKVYLEQKKYGLAIAEYNEAIRVDANLVDAFIGRGAAHCEEKNFARGMSDLDHAVKLNPQYADARFVRGQCYSAQRNFISAIADYTDAIRADPQYWDAFLWRAGAYFELRDYVRSIADATEAIRLEPKARDAYLGRGAAYVQTKQYELALADMDEAIRLEPQAADGYLRRADVHVQRKDYDRAIADYTEGIQLAPTVALAYAARGEVYRLKGENDRALADYNQALRFDPKIAVANAGRAYVYWSEGERDRVIGALNEAITHYNPQNVNAYSIRAGANLDKGEYDLAISDYNEVIRLDPRNVTAYFGRGAALAYKGERDRAIADYRNAVALPAQSSDARRKQEIARERLRRLTRPLPAVRSPTSRRVALVIANAGYTEIPPLANTINDARAIAESLRRLGFDDVIEVYDASLSSMDKAVGDFSMRAEGTDWAIVFFAGHGLEMEGTNYLIPTDAKLKNDNHVTDQALSLDRVMAAVDGARVGVVILDACRVNPFLAGMARTGGAGRIGNGLARVEPDGNVIVAYSAKAGTFASDGVGDHSPYAEALLAHLEEPGLELEKLFRKVRDKVRESTGQEQDPAHYAHLSGEDFFLKAMSGR
jgi:tetratricopeptide (TPR) repeat protein